MSDMAGKAAREVVEPSGSERDTMLLGGISDQPTPSLRRGGHRTRRDRGNGAFGESDIEGKAAVGSGENGAVGTRAT